MKVIRARVLGYCMGVERAVALAERILSKTHSDEGKAVYALGPLIHNPLVLSALEQRGLRIVGTKEEVSEGSSVLIRAHGTSPATLRFFKEKQIAIYDATCPRVHQSQKRVHDAVTDGRVVIIAGDRAHGEVTSIEGFAKEGSADAEVCVIQNEAEATSIPPYKKAVLIAQTTFSRDVFTAITTVLRQKILDLLVFDSICSATMERQNALLDLCGKTDGIIIVGGKNSANTRRLYEKASSFCAMTALIENYLEIPKAFFALNSVGLTAGASTPLSAVDEVEKVLLQGLKENTV